MASSCGSYCALPFWFGSKRRSRGQDAVRVQNSILLWRPSMTEPPTFRASSPPSQRLTVLRCAKTIAAQIPIRRPAGCRSRGGASASTSAPVEPRLRRARLRYRGITKLLDDAGWSVGTDQAALIAGISATGAIDVLSVPATAGSDRADAIISLSRRYKKSPGQHLLLIAATCSGVCDNVRSR